VCVSVCTLYIAKVETDWLVKYASAQGGVSSSDNTSSSVKSQDREKFADSVHAAEPGAVRGLLEDLPEDPAGHYHGVYLVSRGCYFQAKR